MRIFSFRLVFLFSTTLAVSTASAQDIITFMNGDVVKAKVLEISPEVIKYKRWDNQGGPIYSTSRNDISMIKYVNGTKDVFSNTQKLGTNTTSRSTDDNTIKSVDAVKQKQEVEKTNQDQQVFVEVDEVPEFPGGELGLRTFIAKALLYPTVAQENGIQGKVLVTFVVNKDGTVSDIQIAKSVDKSLDTEAMRVVSTMPKWKPGKQYGKPVRVSYTVPISFTLR